MQLVFTKTFGVGGQRTNAQEGLTFLGFHCHARTRVSSPVMERGKPMGSGTRESLQAVANFFDDAGAFNKFAEGGWSYQF